MQHGRIVEQGPAAQVLTHPQQAYTRALLDAAPGRGWDFANFRPVAAACDGVSRSRHCERREAIHGAVADQMDCFASLAMTARMRGMQNGIASSLALLAMTSLTSRIRTIDRD